MWVPRGATKYGDLISAYNNKACANMSDEELACRAKQSPIKGTEGKGFVAEDQTLDMILERFYPGHKRADARQHLVDFVLEEEENQDKQLGDGWEEAAEEAEDVVSSKNRSDPSPAGEDTPVPDMPARQTRGGKAFTASLTEDTNNCVKEQEHQLQTTARE